MKAPLILAPNGRPARAELGIQAHYEAAQWHPARSAIQSALQSVNRDASRWSRRELLRKARYFTQNSPFVRGLIERLVSYVIGTGLTPGAASSDLDWNQRADRVWRAWTPRADLTSRSSFATLQGVLYRSALVDGDCFTLLTYGASGRPRIQLIEAHLITDAKSAPFDAPDGVVVDSLGRPTGYRYTPDEGTTFRTLEADTVVQHWFPERPGQYRGIPVLAAALNTAHDMDDILVLEKLAVKEAAAHVNVIKTAQGELDPESAFRGEVQGGSREDGNRYYQAVFGPESKVLRQGDEFTPYKPERPSPAWAGFMEYLCESICLSAGIPPSVLLQVKVGGADTRRDLAAAQREFERQQQQLAGQFQRIWEYVIEAEITDGSLRGAPEDWRNVTWQYPKAITVDAGREAQADREDVRAGLLTLEEYAGRYGLDWRAQVGQLAREAVAVQEAEEAAGLSEGFLVNRLYTQNNQMPANAAGGTVPVAALQAAVLATIQAAFNPNQPRDARGRFASGSASAVGQTGDAVSLGLPPSDQLPTSGSMPHQIDQSDALSQLQRTVVVTDPTGNQVVFGEIARRHFEHPDHPGKTARARFLPAATAAATQPAEIWERDNRHYYIASFELDTGGKRGFLVVAARKGETKNEAITFHPKDVRKMDAERRGKLLWVKMPRHQGNQ